MAQVPKSIQNLIEAFERLTAYLQSVAKVTFPIWFDKLGVPKLDGAE